MKSRVLKISSVLAAMFMLIAAMPVSVFAASQLIVNTKTAVNQGEDITFNLNLADCEVPIIGLQMYISYNKSCLEYVDDSIEFDKLDGVVYNDQLDGMIAITWTDISNETDFSSKASLLRCKFKVIGTGETDITYYISHMYGDDMGYVKNYTFTNDIVPDKCAPVYDEPAVVTTDEEFLSSHSGSFINYDDSMGENSPNAGTHKAIISKVVDATRYENVGVDGGSGGTPILIIAAGVVLVLAIIAVVIVKKRDDAKKSVENSDLGQ